jgi:hypothetical protein
MQFINKTGLVLIGAAFLSAPVFVGCDDDKDGTDLTGGSGGTAGTAGTAGSAGSAGNGGSSGAGGDGGDSGVGGSAGEGGTGGTGGSSSDPDAGDGGVNPALAWAEAICATQQGLASGGDAGDAGLTCSPPEGCAEALVAAFPNGCEAPWNAMLECFSTQPVTAFECTGSPESPVGFRVCSEEVRALFVLPDCGPNTHGCLAEECAFWECAGAVTCN